MVGNHGWELEAEGAMIRALEEDRHNDGSVRLGECGVNPGEGSF